MILSSLYVYCEKMRGMNLLFFFCMKKNLKYGMNVQGLASS